MEGCNPIAATWPDATAIATVAGAVAPAEALDAIWKFDPASSTWKGYSPTAPAAVNDLASVDRLDAIFVCVNAAATIEPTGDLGLVAGCGAPTRDPTPCGLQRG